MRALRYLCVFLLLVCAAFVARAYEVIEVCATYTNTGKRYKVEANVYEGSDLNRRTKSFDYDSFGKYVVIFWSKEKASVIKLDSPFGGIGTFGSQGQDQQGRPWETCC